MKSPRTFRIISSSHKPILPRITSPAFDTENEQTNHHQNIPVGTCLSKFGFRYLKKANKNFVDSSDDEYQTQTPTQTFKNKGIIPSDAHHHINLKNQKVEAKSQSINDYLDADMNLSKKLASFKIFTRQYFINHIKRSEKQKAAQSTTSTPQFQLYLQVNTPKSARSIKSNISQSNFDHDDLMTQFSNSGLEPYKLSRSFCSTPKQKFSNKLSGIRKSKYQTNSKDDNQYLSPSPMTRSHELSNLPARPLKKSIFKYQQDL